MAAGHRRRRRAACWTAVSTAPGSDRMGRAGSCGSRCGAAIGFTGNQQGPGDAGIPGGLRQHRDLTGGERGCRAATRSRDRCANGHGASDCWRRGRTACADCRRPDARCLGCAVCRRVACCRGVSPHQAAKSRAELNWRPSPIAVTTACAVSPPMPGMVVSRRITGLSRAIAMIRSSRLAIAVLRASICWISSRSTSTASEGMSASPACDQRDQLLEAALALRRR